MNTSLPADYLERMKQDDPEAYRSEVLGEFRSGVATFFELEALEACVVTDRREVPPVAGAHYRAFVDPSGGSRDAFTLAIAHRDGEQTVVDCVRAWPAPFNPSSLVAEAAALLKSYRVATVTGDRYAGEWPREQFRAKGIAYKVASLDRSALYLELLPRVNASSCNTCDRVHSGFYDRSMRRVRDLPCGGMRIFLEIEVRRV
ncbi:MAG: transposase family protein, partial [Deltaproteobacteria bacterium]|nr:transposase family protein [Deltaproteobacteria bacterium]